MKAPTPECYLVNSRLLAGKYPGALQVQDAQRKVKALVEAGVRTFIDLTEVGELLPYAHLLPEGVSHHRIAVRDVKPGEQLTCEYGTLNLLTPMACYCGAPSCRGTIHRDDSIRHFERWDEESRNAFALAHKVAQPLLPYAKLGPRDLPLIEAMQAGRAAWVPSSRDFHIVEVPEEVQYAAVNSAQ